ncbi:bifunctional diguanylate cyclase/phosphodiesterase [Neiella marina]|uniref:Bifunctional diguanylate cyclase/phosphodiesterase n=1 Tax=Neiella holothuriorum TaxID=2870530 RepID=A0ABS7EK82_9GAMM|nr:bifunctional diguanylate cyclase/phosphodiesterase [Neiella holothuriorum]MBW8192082.1 bifunctional diguanylate cyclase/phosphodiesterase [Neiella holothuriorum]
MMRSLKLAWLATMLALTIALAYVVALTVPGNQSRGDKTVQQLDLISELLARDIQFTHNHLSGQFQQADDRINAAMLTDLAGRIAPSSPLQFQEFIYRVRGKAWVATTPLGAAERLPRKLEPVHWLCQPSCQLLLKASRNGDELVVVVDLDSWLQSYEQKLGYQLQLANSVLTSLPNSETSSVEQDIGVYFASQHQQDWFNASDRVLPDWPMLLTGRPLQGTEVAAHWYVLLGLLLLALLGLILLPYFQWQRQLRWQGLFQQLGHIISDIEAGKFSRLQKQLVPAMQQAPKLAQPFVRKLAMYGLQDEATRVTLARISNDKDWLSHHDGMTGLANRESFYQLLKETIRDADTSALLLIDIDDFKEINDASGHQLGNDMLMKLASILAEHVHLPFRAARIAGDEFAVWMPSASLEQGEQMAGKLLESSRQIMLAGDKMLHRLSLSIGVVVAPEHGDEPDVLMTRADIALNYSKSQGKGRFASLRDPDLEGYLLKQRFMYSRVHSAIRDQRLALAYQPIVQVSDGQLSHYEVLLRIEDEIGNYVSAYPLIQAAERQRDVGVLDKWVLNQVLTLLMQLRRNGQKHRLAVNISGMSMSDAQLTETLLQRIEFSGCGPDLVIEITESAALENINLTQKNIERLQALGCQVALDDFGVGYSSVNNLLSLPFDYVKVDGCFIRKLNTDDAVVPLLEFLVNISNLRGFQLVAEFVENEQVAKRLEQIGVQFAQGYFYGKPELGRLSIDLDDGGSAHAQRPQA